MEESRSDVDDKPTADEMDEIRDTVPPATPQHKKLKTNKVVSKLGGILSTPRTFTTKKALLGTQVGVDIHTRSETKYATPLLHDTSPHPSEHHMRIHGNIVTYGRLLQKPIRTT